MTEEAKMVVWVLLLFLLEFHAEGVVRFVAPEGPQTLHIEFKVYAESASKSSIEEVQLTILYSVHINTIGFVDCMRGPNVGCVSKMNTLPNFVVWTCYGITPAQFAECQEFDFDADNDVDLADFAIYQQQYTTPEAQQELDFDPAGERIMQIYLNPMDRGGYDSLALIPMLNDEFTAIGLHGWSWHRYPDMFDDPEIQTAITAIKAKGMKFVIGRDLWPRWIPDHEKDSWATSRAMPFDDKWIREELEAAVAEKKRYGAWATFVDAEPYGQERSVEDRSERVYEGSRHVLMAKSRTHGWELAMTIHERRIFAETLRRVRKSTGLSWDFVYPSTSSATEDYPWACREIGKYACVATCYYLKDITDHIPVALEPGYPFTVPVWFSAVTNPSVQWGNSTTLTPDQVRHIWSQFEQGKQLYPELKAFMVYSGGGQKSVLEAFQD